MVTYNNFLHYSGCEPRNTRYFNEAYNRVKNIVKNYESNKITK